MKKRGIANLGRKKKKGTYLDQMGFVQETDDWFHPILKPYQWWSWKGESKWDVGFFLSGMVVYLLCSGVRRRAKMDESKEKQNQSSNKKWAKWKRGGNIGASINWRNFDGNYWWISCSCNCYRALSALLQHSSNWGNWICYSC